ncbi:MAG: right-handed parallel beta-helix repeat-containing protein [Planctomycetota bacterium]
MKQAARKMALLAMGFACVALALSALGGEKVELNPNAFFVSPDGSDENPGTLEAPFRTIRHAVVRAVRGMTVYVRAGVYDELVWITEKYGNPEKIFTLENYPGERPTIDRNCKDQYGIVVMSRYATVRGFELRNIKGDPTYKVSMAALTVGNDAHHVVLENNLIHHVIGGGRAARGIHVAEGAHDILIQNNTVHNITGNAESMGIQVDGAAAVTIRRNLVYFADKEAIRLITQDTDTENVVEENIVLHSAMGMAINHARTTKQILVRNNFCGWNWARGMNPKHTRNITVEHNTFVGNEDWGYDSHGNGSLDGDVAYLTLKNNLFSRNRSEWWLNEREVLYETVDYNFYDHAGNDPLASFNWSDADQCHTLKDIQEKTRNKGALNGPYETNGKEGVAGFVAPEKGDYRLKPDSAARGAVEEGKDAGVIEGTLVEVGADHAWGLRNIPDLGMIPLTVQTVSSETEKGPAKGAVDASRRTYWEALFEKDPNPEIVLDLPGEAPYALTDVILTKPDGGARYFYKDFAIETDDGSGQWVPVAAPAAHPFSGYRGLQNGETWSMPQGTKACRVKIRVLTGYGNAIQMPGIRIYGTSAKE